MSLVNVASAVVTKVSAVTNSVSARIATNMPISADASQYFQSVENKFESAINSVLPFVWMAVAVAIIGIGLMCIIGSERSKEMAKGKFVAVVIGCALVLGAIYIGKGISAMLTFKG